MQTAAKMDLLKDIQEKCIECPLCQRECQFLKKFGTPKAIADQFDPTLLKYQTLPFECSLCGLCTAVCPVTINPAYMFLEMRRRVVRLGGKNFQEYAPLLRYEKRGVSKRYTFYGFPDHCQTVFFPGCALSGTRPDTVWKVFQDIGGLIPYLGIVLDCCAKPSHDLGRDDYFRSMFGEMKGYLIDQGIRTILAACPNCYKMFKEYGAPLQIRSVYEILAEDKDIEGKRIQGTVTIHDPCVTRFEKPIQEAVRNLIQSQGVSMEEMEHQRANALCCGEGGAVGFIAPELSESWGAKIKEEARGKRILTYCAGCVNWVNRFTPANHVLDFFYEPEATLSGRIKGSKTPITYWNRIRLKKRFQKIRPALEARERPLVQQ